MNLYRFVNSKDIRNHLQKIGYEFSSVEAAWLIDQCRDASIEEKHSAWSELIETMPDCRIEERRNAIPCESLHEYLRESMSRQNREIEEVRENDDSACDSLFDGFCFFFPTPFQKGDILWDPESDSLPFVMNAIAPDLYTESGREECLKDGDETDMIAAGYFIDLEDGSESWLTRVPKGVIYDSIDNYMNLEYYPGELQDIKRLLIAYSSFLKGEIDVALLTRAYHQILSEEQVLHNTEAFYSTEEARLAGLSLNHAFHVKIWVDERTKAPEGYYRCHSFEELETKYLEFQSRGIMIDVIDCAEPFKYKTIYSATVQEWLEFRKAKGDFAELVFHEDSLISLSPDQMIRRMFEYTDEEGRLILPEWPYDDKDPDEPDYYYSCILKWQKEDWKTIVWEYRKLEERLKAIDDEEPLKQIIEANRDIRPFAEMDSDSDLKELANDVKDATYATYDVALRAMRLSRLYAQNAPEVIINNEAQLLAQAMVINRYAVRFETKEIEIPFV